MRSASSRVVVLDQSSHTDSDNAVSPKHFRRSQSQAGFLHHPRQGGGRACVASDARSNDAVM